MSEFIQVGITAARDPVTGEFLPAVPLYVRAEDRTSIPEPFDGDLRALFAEKMKEYRKAAARAKGASA